MTFVNEVAPQTVWDVIEFPSILRSFSVQLPLVLAKVFAIDSRIAWTVPLVVANSASVKQLLCVIDLPCEVTVFSHNPDLIRSWAQSNAAAATRTTKVVDLIISPPVDAQYC